VPSVKSIDFSDGIRIVSNNLPEVWIKGKDFPKISPSEAEKEREMEGILSRDIQANYEVKTLLSEYPDDDPVKQDPPQLLINERIEKIKGKDYLVAITIYVAVHVYSTSPLKYTIRCQNSRAGAIGGEWWL